MSTIMSRRRAIGLGSGSVWLVAVSAAFALWALLSVNTPVARQLSLVVGAASLLLITWGVVLTRAATRIPLEARRPEEHGLGRVFILVIVLEVVGISLANWWAAASRNTVLIPALDLAIIGIHFLPLAVIFRVPRYLLLGFLFCLIPLVTLLVFSRASLIGAAPAWLVVPSLGCGVTAMLIAAANMWEVWRGTNTLKAPAQQPR